jgi:hypothetical protein
MSTARLSDIKLLILPRKLTDQLDVAFREDDAVLAFIRPEVVDEYSGQARGFAVRDAVELAGKRVGLVDDRRRRRGNAVEGQALDAGIQISHRAKTDGVFIAGDSLHHQAVGGVGRRGGDDILIAQEKLLRGGKRPEVDSRVLTTIGASAPPDVFPVRNIAEEDILGLIGGEILDAVGGIDDNHDAVVADDVGDKAGGDFGILQLTGAVADVNSAGGNVVDAGAEPLPTTE